MAMQLNLDSLGDMENGEIFDLLKTTNGVVMETLSTVNNEPAPMNPEMRPPDPQSKEIYGLLMEHKDRVLELRASVEQYRPVFCRQTANASTQTDQPVHGLTIPNGAREFNLRKATKKDIEPLLDLTNKNECLKKLGFGTFGDVYKVKYKGQIVALKHMTNILYTTEQG